MTKKDYIKIAAVFYNTLADLNGTVGGHNGPISGINLCLLQMANMLQEDNPRFDRERFLAACMEHKL